MRSIIAIIIFFCLVTCTSDRSADQQNYFEDCAYTSPTAIFSNDIAEIEYHTFELEREKGIEKVVFNDGLELEITQQGCNTIQQDFKFLLHTDYISDDSQYWIQQAGKLFYFIGGLEEQYLPLYEWGNAIIQNSAQMRLNRSFEVFDGFAVKVSLRKDSPQQLLLIVTLLEK